VSDNELGYISILIEIFISFIPTNPTCFRIGDIVEVQFTISAVPVKKEKFKMILNLRSLALVDGDFTEVTLQYIKN
jgi:hypothetical protein